MNSIRFWPPTGGVVVLHGDEEITVTAELSVAPTQTAPMPMPMPGEPPENKAE